MEAATKEAAARGFTLPQVVAQGIPRGRVQNATVRQAMMRGVTTLPEDKAPPIETAPALTEEPPTPPAKGERNTDPANTKFERARRALLREGVMKDDEIRALDRQDAIRRGLKLERAQNRRASEFARLKAAAEKKGEGSPDPSNGATSIKVATPSDETWLADLFTQLGLSDDDDAKATLTEKLSPVLAERAQIKRELDERARAEGPDVNQLARFQRVRAEATESIPELGDDDDFVSSVAPVMDALMSSVPKFATAMKDDAVLRDLMETAARVALEEVGERDEPTPQHSAVGRGFIDVSGASAPRPGKPLTEKEVFLQQVTAELQKRGLSVG